MKIFENVVDIWNNFMFFACLLFCSQHVKQLELSVVAMCKSDKLALPCIKFGQNTTI